MIQEILVNVVDVLLLLVVGIMVRKMIWMYKKKDYDEYPKDKLSEYIPKENDNYTKIVCLNTGEVFDGLIYAAEKIPYEKREVV